MLTQNEINTIRTKLEAERNELLEHIAVLSGGNGQYAGRNPDRSDLASAYTVQDRRLAILSVEQSKLQEVTAALERIKTGTYGTCDKCGKPIAPERLLAIPYAKLCMACQP